MSGTQYRRIIGAAREPHVIHEVVGRVGNAAGELHASRALHIIVHEAVGPELHHALVRQRIHHVCQRLLEGQIVPITARIRLLLSIVEEALKALDRVTEGDDNKLVEATRRVVSVDNGEKLLALVDLLDSLPW